MSIDEMAGTLFTVERIEAVRTSGDTGAWSLSRLQVVNWGGFNGHHSVDLADEITLLTGPSGTGKSTLLDAIIGVLMDSNVPFNGASNEAAGRARGRAQRNIVSYMRGKLADTVGDESAVAILRGDGRPTWSAIGLTWTSASGSAFSAFRAYYASASAVNDPDLVREYYTAPFDFDLALLEPFAANRFNKREVKAAFATIKPHGDSYTSLAADVTTRLGIGNGRDRKALHLLARVQRGGSMTSVDHLFRDFVLSTPATFERAEAALGAFESMSDAYNTMDTARRKLARLASIGRQHSEMTAAADGVRRNDSYRAADTDSPFALWGEGLRFRTLDDAERRLANDRRTLQDAINDATRENRELRTAAERSREAFRAGGGDALARLSERATELDDRRATISAARDQFDATCAQLGVTVTSPEELVAVQADPGFTEEALREEIGTIQTRMGDVHADEREANAEAQRLADEIAYYESRRDLVPLLEGKQRNDIAATLGLRPEDLPFVAETIDMHEDCEEWRTAVELALGGWALRVLVPAAHASAFRRAANSRTWARRLRWDVVQLDVPAPPAADASKLPGRLIVRGGAFENVIRTELNQRYNLTCVNDVADLDRIHQGLTITGQTRTGSHGAHGGTAGHRPIIGFSNDRLLASLRADHATAKAEAESLGNTRTQLQADIGELLERVRPLGDLHAIRWADIDRDAASADAAEAAAQLEQARAQSGGLAELEQLISRLDWEADEAAGRRESAKTDWKTADTAWRQTVEAKDDVARREQVLQSRIGELSDDQQQHLDSLLDRVLVDSLSPANVEQCIGKVRRALQESTQSEARTRDNLSEALSNTFKAFNEEWPDNNRGSDPYLDYQSFADIHDELSSGGLGALADRFRAQVAKWSSEDLLLLQEAFRASRDEIKARLDPINDVLKKLEFGRDARRLSIEMADTPSREVSDFRRELANLASGTTAISDSVEAERRFTRISALMAQISRDNRANRDALLDVRRHIHVQAIQHNPDPMPNQRFDTLGEQSGGESQELVAFILGAALRYQLGDADSAGPRYRTVVLDEAFIKADPQFLGRGIAAWQQLGFQLVIGAPVDKFTALEPFTDRIWITCKGDDGKSSVEPMTRTTMDIGADVDDADD